MSSATTTSTPASAEVNLTLHPTAKKVVDKCIEFFAEVENLYDTPQTLAFDPPLPPQNKLTVFSSTPGKDLEKMLNEKYGPGNSYYEDFCKYIREGIAHDEGWVATVELDGPKYRRSKVALPKAETRYFSITTVYMNSIEEYAGQYHQHVSQPTSPPTDYFAFIFLHTLFWAVFADHHSHMGRSIA